MSRRVYCNVHGVLIIWAILGGIQGHPHRHSEDQRSVKHHVPTQEAILSNRNEPQLPGSRIRESLAVSYESRVNAPVMNTRQNFESDGKIVFPSDQPSIGTRIYTPPAAAVCQNATFCENPPDYPSDLIRNALKARDDLKHLANVEPIPDIGERVDVELGDPMCHFEEALVYPRSAESTDKEWYYIVNEDTFSQGVRIEKCRSENAECDLIKGFAGGNESACRQKYIYRQLAAVSPNGTISTKFFRFAASCCCHVKVDVNARFSALVGVGGRAENSQSPVPRKTASRAERTGEK